MNSFSWQLEQHTARGRQGGLHAVLELAEPWRGLGQLHIDSHQLRGVALLGVALPSEFFGSKIAPSDARIRGSDVAASYRPASPPVQVDALWRVGASHGADAVTAVVDLIVSLQTEQLKSAAELAVESILPCDEILRLTAATDTALTILDVGESPLAIKPEDGVSCLLCRLSESELSYVEMVHPADFCQDRVEGLHQVSLSSAKSCLTPRRSHPRSHPRERTSGVVRQILKITHRLFPEPLEKGVILRARVRGVLFPRKDDARLAAALFASFAAAEPPLGA